MLFHTENNTTQEAGQSIATVICDSTYRGDRITTLELVYPRYIHSEVLTHRVVSRNASSSRATPIKVLLDEVRNDPVFFDFVGKNKGGMVATEPLADAELDSFQADWYKLANMVANEVERMSELYGVHKQTLNRALEPFSRIRVLVTATDWDNFFKLRLAADAQPEIRVLAQLMKDAMCVSEPVERRRHLPYVSDGEADHNDMPKISVARCARVSYGRLDGKPNDAKADIELYDRLLESGHMSPFEHVAYSVGDGLRFANFKGWQSLRRVLGK